jgi:hypothetical protein
MARMRWIAFLFALGAGLPALPGHGQEPAKAADLMRKKLVHAQGVLEGLALNDLDKVSQNARNLMDVSKQAEWRVLKTPQYELYSNEFRRAAETLGQRAKEKNIDGAALAYVELTLTCVRCHKHVREIRMARLDQAPFALARQGGR